MPTKHLILCGSAQLSTRKGSWRSTKPVTLRTGRRGGNVNLRIGDITTAMTADLPDIALDLLEVATYVYCADQATSRGQVDVIDYGKSWHRHFRFEVPVRNVDLWRSETVRAALESTLGFLAGEKYEFVFSPLERPHSFDEYLEFHPDCEQQFGIEEVLLFSGGIDSFAGAVREITEKGRKIALVSHRSVAKIDARQKRLVRALARKIRRKGIAPFHVPVWINKDSHLTREYTQRARSFLYASLGAVVARMFDLNRIRFYENGVVSFNLPICAQVIGSRASRTTHPQVLNGFETLFSLLFNVDFRVENPFLWMTKTEVLEDIKSRGYARLCASTVSCGRTVEASTEFPHCGRCSQCVDRRLTALAAGYSDKEDPARGYRSDVLLGPRPKTEDRTLVESYVRTANEVETIEDATQFCVCFPEISRAFNYLEGQTDDLAEQIFGLHRRHAQQVGRSIDEAVKANATALRRGELDPTCLLSIACGTAALRDRRPRPEDRGAQRRKAPRKRASRAVAIEALRNELVDHIKSARDQRRDAMERGADVPPLPRPTKKDLATRAGVSPSRATRCFQDESAAELRMLWKVADDPEAVLRYARN